MATNNIYSPGHRISVVCSHPTTPLSGQPCRLGNMTGVALIDEGESITSETTVDFGPGVWDLSVKGANDAGNVAVAAGDPLFYVDADIGDGTGFLSKKASGRFFGFALEAVDSAATATIQVRHIDGVAVGGLNSPATGIINVDLLTGQNGGVDATYAVTGIAVGDEIVFAGHFTTAAAIATLADVTADFSITGAAEVSAVTDFSNDQIMLVWVSHT